jgi:hypothetical protein
MTLLAVGSQGCGPALSAGIRVIEIWFYFWFPRENSKGTLIMALILESYDSLPCRCSKLTILYMI